MKSVIRAMRDGSMVDAVSEVVEQVLMEFNPHHDDKGRFGHMGDARNLKQNAVAVRQQVLSDHTNPDSRPVVDAMQLLQHIKGDAQRLHDSIDTGYHEHAQKIMGFLQQHAADLDKTKGIIRPEHAAELKSQISGMAARYAKSPGTNEYGYR